MNLGRFVSQRSERWDELQSLIGRARGRPDRLSARELRTVGRLYRSTIADLAWARKHAAHDPVTARLSRLAVQSRQLVYDADGHRFHPVRFFLRDYWRLVAERPGALIAAALFLSVPALLAAIWSQADPAAATGLVPDQFRDVLAPGPGGTDQGLSVEDQVAFSTFLIVNNVTVSILAFATGIFFTIGGAYVLANNGLVLGAVGGLLAESGELEFFIELVAAHGVLELSCIVIAGAAGFRMGWSLIDPGPLSRRAALVAEAASAAKIIIGTVPWFAVAGIIEAFISRRGLDATPMAVVGLAVGATYWGLVWFVGRAETAEAADQSRALAFAST